MKDRYVMSALGVWCVLYGWCGCFMVRTMVERAERMDAEVRPFRERAGELIAGLDGFPGDVSEIDWAIALKRIGLDRQYSGQRCSRDTYEKIIEKFKD